MSSLPEPSNILSAFELLLEEVEAEIDHVNRLGARAFEARDFDGVRAAVARAETITAYRDRVAALRQEWRSLNPDPTDDDDADTGAARRKRLPPGMRTSPSAYYVPILRAIAARGGRATYAEVIEEVGQVMRPLLKEIDLVPAGEEHATPRWLSAAQWARYSMVKTGLLKADSPRGIWEISAAGEAYLAQNQG